MKLDNISLPHPVLGLSGDSLNSSEEADVMGLFDVSQTLTAGSKIEVKIEYELLNSPQLARIISEGKAQFACEVSCRKTVFRQVFLSPSCNQLFSLSADDLRDQLVFDYFILATADFAYKDEGGWHPDYVGRTFEIKRGMVLGYGGSLKHMLERTQVASKRGASLISVECGEKDSGPFEIDVNDETLTIFLPKKIYVAFDNLYNNNERYAINFHASLVIPTLIHALTLMATDEGKEYQDKQWYQALETKISKDPKLRELELTQSTALEIAQVMIDCPFSHLTEDLANVEPEEIEE